MTRVAALFLCALAAPSLAARINQEKESEALALEARVQSFMSAGVWLTEQCQDYPEAMGFGLGDTVRIFKEGSREHNHVGLVGCQDPSKPGQVCLEGAKGCYDVENVRPISTLVFSFYTIGGAASQIFGAIKDDIMEAWEDLRLSLGSFASSVSNQLTAARGQVYDKLNVCAAKEGEVSQKEFDVAVVQSKSRLAVLVDSAVQRWGALKEGVKNMATTAMAKLVKIANYLSEKLSEFYDAHLKDIVEALKRYLGGIVNAVMNVPDELNPLAGPQEQALSKKGVPTAAPEPGALSKFIEGFVDKVGQLGAKVVDLSKAAYETVADGLSALMSGTGRLIAYLSEKFVEAKDTVVRLASAAWDKINEWGDKAKNAMCNFDAKQTAIKAWDGLKAGVQKAMTAVKDGATYVVESVQACAASLAASVAAAALYIKEKSLALYNSETVQAILARIREEIRVLGELLAESAGLVAKFLGGFVRYFGRFVPQWVKDKFKAGADKAKLKAQEIQQKIAELYSKLTDGESDTVVVDANQVTVDS